MGSTIPVYCLFHSLSIAANYKHLKAAQRKEYLTQIRSHRDQFHKWAEDSPENYACMHFLVEGVLAFLEEKYKKSEAFYNEAIQSAKENGFTLYEGIGYELIAQFYIETQKEIFAKAYFQEAHRCYLHWGATEKVRWLERQYPLFINPSFTISQESRSGGIAMTESLGLNAILYASQAISQEIHLDPLLKKLMDLLLKNMGAQKGILLLKQEDHFWIRTEGNMEQVEDILLVQVLYEDYLDIPHKIVNYVINSQENLIYTVSQEKMALGIFDNDPYMMTHSPKSILCSPLIYQGGLLGVLYLENRLLPNVFTEERVRIIQVLYPPQKSG
ncbi:GAF domain-containing protein [Deltaproteobacteria bacterium TL4]